MTLLLLENPVTNFNLVSFMCHDKVLLKTHRKINWGERPQERKKQFLCTLQKKLL